MLTLTYEYKLIPDQQQTEVIENTLDVCRSVWNFALRERKDWLSSRKSPVNACSLSSDTRKDWHFKLAHSLCDQAQSIFIEDISFIS